MIEHPKAEELAQAVAGFLESIRSQLNPRDAFLARVAANAMGVIGRELAGGRAAEDAAAARLGALLSREGGLDDLNADLCARLRTGEMDAATPGLLAALRANITDQIVIDQPTYAPEPR